MHYCYMTKMLIIKVQSQSATMLLIKHCIKQQNKQNENKNKNKQTSKKTNKTGALQLVYTIVYLEYVVL